jgi:hypothetical protein
VPLVGTRYLRSATRSEPIDDRITPALIERPIIASGTHQPNTVSDRVMGYLSTRPGRNSSPVTGAGRALHEIELVELFVWAVGIHREIEVGESIRVERESIVVEAGRPSQETDGEDTAFLDEIRRSRGVWMTLSEIDPTNDFSRC